jgi:hypothetical protein
MKEERGAAVTAAAPPEIERIERRGGRAVRLVATAVIGALLLAGTLFGQDDSFPFGPFRMYSTTDSLDAPVKSTRMEAVDTTGRRFALRGEAVGLRRAEIEGQMTRFRADPGLLASIAEAYDNRHPHGPELARIEIITRHFELDGGRPTGEHHDTVDVSWSRAGGAR